jgi:hypothetical protein
VQVEAADGVEAREGPDHEYVAVGEVDELYYSVDHGVAEGDEGVDEAELEPVEEILEEERGVRPGFGPDEIDGQQGEEGEEGPSHPCEGWTAPRFNRA